MAGGPAPQQRFGQRVADAIPPATMVLFGSVVWGLAIAASALVGLYVRDGLIIFSRMAVLSLFFYGPALAFAPGLLIAGLLAGRTGPLLRFAIGTIVMALATHTATAAVFALQYRVFYSHWHADFPSITWGYQLAFTSAAAVYQFTVDSLYIYYPLAPLPFLLFGLWFARRSH
jgi:hypothetical protein